MTWSVKFLLSNPAAVWVRFPAGSEILISILGLDVVSCAVSDGDPDILKTTDTGKPALVLLSSVLVHTLTPSTAGYHIFPFLSNKTLLNKS